MRELRAFASAFRQSVVAQVSGGIGLVAAAVGLWGPNVSGKWLYILTGFVGVLVAAFLVWREEHRRANRSDAKVADLTKEIETRALIRPPPSPLDVLQDTEVQTKVSALDDTLRAALFKVALAGEASISDNGMETIRQRTGFLVRDGVIFRIQEGWRDPLRRWAEGEAAEKVALPE